MHSGLPLEGSQGPGKGKHIVFVSGDEEYRSEEALPMLARILAERHGFTCTVLFAIDPATGTVNPNINNNIPGLHLLDSADLMVLFTRWRELPDEQMKHIVDYTNSGRPIVALRTATHPFMYKKNPGSQYARYSDDAPDGGFGRQVIGEKWIRHHGDHGKESTRGLVNGLMEQHPVLRGVRDVWGPSDVYGIRDVTGDEQVLLYGQVLTGMDPSDPPNLDKSLMPIAWVKNYNGETGKTTRVLATTMGAAVDLQNEHLRRLLVNAAYWMTGLEKAIPEQADVTPVGKYVPTSFGFNDFQKDRLPVYFFGP